MALPLTGGKVREAARRLGIGRATIYRKIESYGIKLGASGGGVEPSLSRGS